MESAKVDRPTPSITSLWDLEIVESWDPGAKEPKLVSFFHITAEDEVFFGESTKRKTDITLDEYRAALQPVPDEKIYPEVPEGITLKIAPDNLNDDTAFVKRPGLINYSTTGVSYDIPRNVLAETHIMEEISKNPHPSIIKYHGCRVNRGRITALLLEPLEQTLAQLAETPAFKSLDTAALADAIESATSYLHDMGLAHNDISPHNIMFRKDGEPVLIDFGSCARFEERLQSLGTAGWYEELFFTSEKNHDEFSIRRLREWLVERGEEGSSALPN